MNSQTVDAVVETLKEIENVSPSKDHYSALCLLLTLNKLSDHPEYRNWNPSKGRINCFKEVLPLVEDLLGGSSSGDKKSPSSGKHQCITALPEQDRRHIALNCILITIRTFYSFRYTRRTGSNKRQAHAVAHQRNSL